MSERPSDAFDETLLSGYLDGALTQQQTQRVRLQLERSEETRRLLAELRTMREATMTTQFEAPDDRQWQEVGRTALSRGMRGVGMPLLLAWALAMGAWGLWEIASDSETWWQRALLFGGVSALILLFASVAIDRLRDRRSDRYREVEK
ncbi:MAG: hypothetical protein R3190_15140 [Thermoanaerobaculia bacterium]|nr:hypothetical protein [Thermoanaerobaculia bacterium]